MDRILLTLPNLVQAAEVRTALQAVWPHNQYVVHHTEDGRWSVVTSDQRPHLMIFSAPANRHTTYTLLNVAEDHVAHAVADILRGPTTDAEVAARRTGSQCEVIWCPGEKPCVQSVLRMVASAVGVLAALKHGGMVCR